MLEIETCKVIYKNCSSPSDKRCAEHNAAYELCEKMLFSFFGVENPLFKTTATGKPFIDTPRVFFSISHTENRAVCAVSDTNVGVDIEYAEQKSAVKIQKFANRFFVGNEIKLLEKSGFDTKEFFKIWTRKEAYIKMKGFTLSDVKKIDTTLLDIKTFVEGNYIISVSKE